MKKQVLEQLGEEASAFFSVFFRGHAWLVREERRNGQEGLLRSALFILEKQDSLHAKELAARLDVSMPHLSILLEKLEERGHVERRHEKGDRRVVHLSITASGRLELERKRAEMRSRLSEALSETAAEDLERMTSGLRDARRIFEILGSQWQKQEKQTEKE